MENKRSHSPRKPRNHTRKEVIRKVFRCADLYEKNLNRRRLLFVYAGDNREVSSLEVRFGDGQFRHLTGVETPNMNAKEFYRACRDKRLSEADIEKRDDGTTDQKLDMLPSALSDPGLLARSIADYIESEHSNLHTDKLVTNKNHWSMGFKKYRDQIYPLPNTFLNERSGRKQMRGKASRLLAVYYKEPDSRSVWTPLYVNSFPNAEEYHYPEDWKDRPRPE